jgi:uncharacterized protein (DUF58 family)
LSDERSGKPETAIKRTKLVAGTRLGGLAMAGLPLAFLDAGTGLGLAAAVAYDAVLLLGAAIESRVLARRVPAIERHPGPRLVVGIENEVGIHVHNPTPHRIRLAIRDDLPAGWRSDPEEHLVDVPPFARRQVKYKVVPPKRGRFELGDLHVRIDGGLRLGATVATIGAKAEAKVYPNVLGPRRYELAARLGDLRHVGFRSVRRAGGGGEFEQLREYVRGDPYRDLDWKSTAKRQRPITRVYTHERSQQIVILLDTGRMMATELDRLTKLDHAINAALLLSYVALRQGDRVGLVVFGDVVKNFVPPRRGVGQYRRILEALYGVEAEVTYVDFRRLVEFLKIRVPRRALITLFSDLLDETHAKPLADHMALLRKKHLLVCVSMQDPVARRIAEQEIHSSADVFRRAAAADILAERDAVKAQLRKSAIDVLEAPAGDLAVSTVNRYLEIKARQRR